MTPHVSSTHPKARSGIAGLACSDVSKSFGGTRALSDVTVHFGEAGIIAIIGPNGAGKTTLVDILTGFVQPNSGKRFLDGRDITRVAAYETAKLGIVRSFQEVRLIRQISVLENVLLACPRQRGEKLFYTLLRTEIASDESRNLATALEYLEFVGLKSRAFDLAEDLSYGQQKLLSLACCLVTGARIALLDEPVAGLDPEMVRATVALLRRLRDKGTSIVFVEHDLAIVKELADNVIVMDGGKIIARGPSSEILTLPKIMDVFFG
jgi:ABC-type branched-subunit amino acid transport system ATPase component